MNEMNYMGSGQTTNIGQEQNRNLNITMLAELIPNKSYRIRAGIDANFPRTLVYFRQE